MIARVARRFGRAADAAGVEGLAGVREDGRAGLQRAVG
jgi:hypothetical protein